MKKVMILGAGAGQVPFINICKRKNAYVIAVSPLGDYPGIKIADKFYECDTRDKEGIFKIAENEKIDAITTDQTDVSVPSVAYVAEKLGLKGIGYETSLIFTDKYLMRCAARDIGVNVPQFAQVRNLDEANNAIKAMIFPVIVKPTNSSGSRGVYRIDKERDLETFLPLSISYSGNGMAIIEEFIEGKEYLVDGFAIDGKYINLDLGIKEYFNKEGMYISKMCMFSSARTITDRVEKMVLEENKKMIEGSKLKFGITHGEYMYSPKHDKVFLIEVAARGGGVYLSSHLTPKASGINTNKMLIDYLLDDVKIDIDKLELDTKVAAWRCFALREGTISEVKNVDKVCMIEGVDKVCLEHLQVGSHVKELNDDTTKYGPILVSGKSREDCFDVLHKVEKTLEITTENNEKTYPMIW